MGAVGNASGRIFSGWLSDKVGRLRTLRAYAARDEEHNNAVVLKKQIDMLSGD